MIVTLAGLLKSQQGMNLPGADAEGQGADREGSPRPRLDGAEPGRIRRPVVRPRGRGRVVAARELKARGSPRRSSRRSRSRRRSTNFDAILAETDAVMVARGDLGVEMDVARVPAIQKRIIAACHKARVPVITATQMLNSMETSSRPTRAEAADVFNAVLDGTDAVMLSGETAIGQYPVETVATMSRIAAEAEKSCSPTAASPDLGPSGRPGCLSPITEGIVEAASLACRRLDAALLVVATHSGRTAMALSKHRHDTPTLALTDDRG